MKKITPIIVLFLINFSCYANDTEPPSVPTNLIVDNQVGIFSWNSSTDNVEVMEYDVYLDDVYTLTYNHYPSATNGIGLHTLGQLNYGTSHTLKVLARDTSGNESTFSSYTSFVVADPFSIIIPDKIFISRIMNGNNNNKAIEVLNTSNTTRDMSEYELRISHDGSTTWDATYTFPANILLGQFDKIQIGHSGLSLPYCNASVITSSGINYDVNDIISGFDGNDVIGLFHNGVLIDRLGNLGEATTYIVADKLMYRQYYVDEHTPWTELNIEEGSNICEGFIGENYYLLSTPEVTVKNIAVYPNPIRDNFIYIQSANTLEISEVRIYDISGKQVLQQTNSTNEINVQGLQKGMYILQLKAGNQTTYKKIIKQ